MVYVGVYTGYAQKGLVDMETRQCRYCKQDFTPKSEVHAFCSDKCRKAARSGSAWGWKRTAALHRDHYECTECGSKEHLEVHHIVALALGGDHRLSNLQTLCRFHHKQKHKKGWYNEQQRALQAA